MPPPISEDEASSPDDIASVAEERSVTNKWGRPSKKEVKPGEKFEDPIEVAEDDIDEEDDEELDDDEYIVEKIVNHLISPDDGQPRFHVKWEGYTKKSDMTWEPEENLVGTASKLLKAYYDSVGGREKIMAKDKTPDVTEEDQGVEKKKKRGRPSLKGTGTPDGPTANGKRSKKTEPHPATATPPASLNKVAFKPPTGSWEDDVQSIDACEGTDGKVMVFLLWTNGHRTQHPLHVVYKRCPQKMLKFYESHLVFKKGGGKEKDLDIADYE